MHLKLDVPSDEQVEDSYKAGYLQLACNLVQITGKLRMASCASPEHAVQRKSPAGCGVSSDLRQHWLGNCIKNRMISLWAQAKHGRNE